MSLRGALRDHQLRGDRLVRQALGDQSGDLPLASGQPACGIDTRRRRRPLLLVERVGNRILECHGFAMPHLLVVHLYTQGAAGLPHAFVVVTAQGRDGDRGATRSR